MKLGQVPPIVKNARYVHVSQLTGSDPEHDAAVDVDVMYRGSADAGSDVISFQIETKIWMSKTVFVPIKITFKLVELSGKVRSSEERSDERATFPAASNATSHPLPPLRRRSARTSHTQLRIGVRKEKSFVSFMTNPHMKFYVKSEIGHSLYLKDAPFVERKIVSLVKKAIEKKLVWPSVMKIKLLWPRAWQPLYRGVGSEEDSWGKTKEEVRSLRERVRGTPAPNADTFVDNVNIANRTAISNVTNIYSFLRELASLVAVRGVPEVEGGREEEEERGGRREGEEEGGGKREGEEDGGGGERACVLDVDVQRRLASLVANTVITPRTLPSLRLASLVPGGGGAFGGEQLSPAAAAAGARGRRCEVSTHFFVEVLPFVGRHVEEVVNVQEQNKQC